MKKYTNSIAVFGLLIFMITMLLCNDSQMNRIIHEEHAYTEEHIEEEAEEVIETQEEDTTPLTAEEIENIISLELYKLWSEDMEQLFEDFQAGGSGAVVIPANNVKEFRELLDNGFDKLPDTIRNDFLKKAKKINFLLNE